MNIYTCVTEISSRPNCMWVADAISIKDVHKLSVVRIIMSDKFQCKKTNFIKNGYRQCSYTSETAKIQRFIIL